MSRPSSCRTRRPPRRRRRDGAFTRGAGWPSRAELADYLAGRPDQIAQPERLREPPATRLLEELLRLGAGDVARDENDAPRGAGVIALERAVERHAVHPRHLQIADDEIVDAGVDAHQRLFAIARPIDDEA